MAFQGFVDEFTNSPVQQAYSTYLGLDLTGNVQLQWPTLQPETATQAAQVIQVITNTIDTNTVLMPDATLSSIQQTFIFANSSGTNYVVADFTGATIMTVVAGQSWILALTSNTTQAGTWFKTVFGGTITPADAAALVNPGYGLTTLGDLIVVNQAVIDITVAPYTLTNPDGLGHLHVWQPAAGTGVFNLLSAASLPSGFIFALTNQSGAAGTGGTITITPNGGDLINGTDTFILYPQENCYLITDGTGGNWYTIGFGQQVTSSITLPNGTVTAPSLTFQADETTGLYLLSTHNLGVSANATAVATFSGTNTNNPQIFANQGNTLAPPSYAFISDATSGLGLNGNYNPTIVANNVNVCQFNGTSTANPFILANSGNSSTPTYAFAGAALYGMGYDAGDPALQFFTGTSGGASLYVSETVTGVYNDVLSFLIAVANQINIQGANSNMGIGLQARTASTPNAINFYSKSSSAYSLISSLVDTAGTATTLSLQEASAPTATGYMKVSGAAGTQVLALGTTADQVRITAGNGTTILNNLTLNGGFGGNPAVGDMCYYNGTNWVELPIGTLGQHLTITATGPGGALIPAWGV